MTFDFLLRVDRCWFRESFYKLGSVKHSLESAKADTLRMGKILRESVRGGREREDRQDGEKKDFFTYS